MVDGAANFPIIFQQTGVVSKVQESVQRGPEAQQMAAAEEAAQEAKDRQKSVQQPEGTDAENKVRADARGAKGQERQRKRRRRRAEKEKETEQTKQSRPDGGGLVDVVV